MFREQFVGTFEAADKDTSLTLDADEIIETMKSVSGAPEFFSDKKIIDQVINDISG